MRSWVGLLATGLWVAFAHPSMGASTGTGFVINSDGFILTNNHVVTERFEDRDKNIWERECKRLNVKSEAVRGRAHIIGRDKVNDLAVIKVASIGSSASGTADRRRTAAVRIRSLESGMRSLGEELSDRSLQSKIDQEGASTGPEKLNASVVRFAAKPVRPGQHISLYGYPLGESVFSQLKVTRGVVVSTMGPGNDSSVIQIDAAVNPGNSGGPLLDGAGNVVAIVFARMNGAQGFNFAVNAVVAKQLMDSLGVAYATSPSNRPMSIEEQYKRIRPFVVLITCF